MMRVEHIKPKMRARVYFALIAAILVALLTAVVTAVCMRVRPADAAGTAKITIHIYDPEQHYNVAGWIWMPSLDGAEYKISETAAADEQFKKTYTYNNKPETNVARTMTVNVTEAQRIALNDGSAELGMLICGATGATQGEFWTRYQKETGDVTVNLKSLFGGNEAHVYYIRRDSTVYTDIEEAKNALNRVIGVRFTKLTASSTRIEFESAIPLVGTQVSVYKGNTELGTAVAEQRGEEKCASYAEFNALNSGNFDFTANYVLKLTVDGVKTELPILNIALLDSAEFIKKYETADAQNLEYGALYTSTSTTFRVWAPIATSVGLKLYNDGQNGDAYSVLALKKRVQSGGAWSGVWELTVDGNLDGKYYTYVVSNYGAETETIDPYAKACGANGLRGMVVNLDGTNPAGWANDKHLYAKNPAAADVPIVWEASVGDFSSSSDSGMKYKGKYLAFTEQNTTVPGTNLKTGISYLKDLGITYVHLNPVYDFATVDETELNKADNTKDNFNWGYDPQNYNIPEGSFSTDPANGAVRINEFKQMVMALHNAGIGVVMDVVYNHTYSTGGQALHDTVPFYYHRTESRGQFTNDSGCGNATASERSMVRKYIIESILYWANEYHIDGFRFDLMGIHDKVTLNAVRAELDKLDNGNGRKLLIYGEPWSADGTYVADSYKLRIESTAEAIAGTGKYTQNADNVMVKLLFSAASVGDENALNQLDPRIAVFNGSGRDGLRGECRDRAPTSGWVNGAPGDLKRVRRMLEGGIGGYAEGLYTGTGSRNVAYAAAHDNYTLWDHIRGAKHGNQPALYYDHAETNDVKRCKLVASAYMMSTGISFMLAGEEMGRTKYGNENSYNSPSKLNRITWSRQSEFAELYAYYKSLIALRKQYAPQLFSYEKSITPSFSSGSFDTTDYQTGRFVFTRTKNGATLTLDLDPSTLSGYVKIGNDRLNV